MSCMSMTGFGQAALQVSGLSVKVEIRAVNHRFAEYNLRFPREWFVLEEAVRKRLATAVVRGRVDVYATIELADQQREVVVHWDILDALIKAEHEARVRFGLATGSECSLDTWLHHESVISVQPGQMQTDTVANVTLQVVDDAIAKLMAMREREGQRIEADLQRKLLQLEKLVQTIQVQDSSAVTAHRTRLLKKLQDLHLEVDETRLLTEVALVVDRAAVDEEIVRLDSHIQEFQRTLGVSGSIGRRLDFIVQEMHREVNTIGSKSVDLHVSKAVVDAKVIVEQLREQAQNIE